MSSRRTDVLELHPIVRDRVRKLMFEMAKQALPFRIFEAYRTPQRQAELYAKGRIKPGRKVTRADAWQSMHQYGLAVDFVLYHPEPGVEGWSWKTTGKCAGYWAEYKRLAIACDLRQLSFELPHVQLPGHSWRNCQAGDYPPGADELWRSTMRGMVAAYPRNAPKF
jgi:hypothetical protein